MVADVGKMAVLALTIVSLAVLRFADAVSEEFFGGVMLLVVGYLIGNGVNAVRGKAPSPVFAPSPNKLTSPDTLQELANYLAPILAGLPYATDGPAQAADDAHEART